MEMLRFEQVSFGYQPDHLVLKNISFTLEQGKTYAFVGPTGGGKSTTAALMARLYQPTKGTIMLKGRNIRDWSAEDIAKEIGFILQEPFLFSGSIMENIIYGNERLKNSSKEEIEREVASLCLGDVLTKLMTETNVSLGQKQLVAFVRAVLRKPNILILDEATANIDTVTEQSLGKSLASLPAATTKVIIAHRLNTIRAADVIYFVNNGSVTLAGNYEHALELINTAKRKS